MRAIGVYLIFAAVTVRGVVVTSDSPYFIPVLGLLAAYGLLLIAETWIIHRRPQDWHPSRVIQFIYLLLQSAIVIGLLAISGYEDFFRQPVHSAQPRCGLFFRQAFRFYLHCGIFTGADRHTVFFQ